MDIETKRLKIRFASLEDSEFFVCLLNQPSYITMIRDCGVRTPKQAADYIEKAYLGSYQKNGFGLYVLELLDTKVPVGIAGFVKRETLEIPDYGFALLDEFKGQGFMREASNALMIYAQDELEFDQLAAITAPENSASIALLERQGFKYIKEVRLNADDIALRYYLINLINR